MATKDITEMVKNSTEAVKSSAELIEFFMKPRGIDGAIKAGHIKIIEDVVASDKYTVEEKELFLVQHRKKLKEMKNCKTVAEIAALDILPEKKAEDIDADWFDFFLDKVRLVSDEAMQKIFASILAEEINNPDSISRSLIHTLSIIDKPQAEAFCNLCRFCWFDLDYDKIHPFIYIANSHSAYMDSRVTWDRLKDLEYLGLIICDSEPGYALTGPRRFRIGNVMVTVKGNPECNDSIFVGNVMLTRNGRKLYDLVDVQYKQYRNDIFTFIENKLIQHNCTVETTNVVSRHGHK